MFHRFACKGELTTADYLMRAVILDKFPDDPQTIEDFGFGRCETWVQKSHLLGLYKGLLIYINVSREELHRWRVEDTLKENIIRVFQTIPKRNRGGYFPWFLQNTHISERNLSSLRAVQ